MVGRSSKVLAALLVAVVSLALAGLVMGCSSSGGSKSASSSASSSISASASSDSASAGSSSEQAAPEDQKSAEAEGASSESATGEAFVGLWEVEEASSGLTLSFQLNDDKTGRVKIYQTGSKDPFMNEPCSWRASSDTTGSIWIGASLTMKLVQNGDAIKVKGFFDASKKGQFDIPYDEAVLYKVK